VHPIEFVSWPCCAPIEYDMLGYHGTLDFYVDHLTRSIALFLEVAHGRQVPNVESFAYVRDPVSLTKVLCSEISCNLLKQEES
jgi:hypothetical protein